MKAKGKIILFICVAVLVCITFLGGAIFYYYAHPSGVKALIEKSVSHATGTSFTIKSLAYSLSPLRFCAKGIAFKPGRDLHDFYLEVPELTADLSLEGHFGHKSLIVKKLKINGFSCRISQDTAVPRMAQKPQPQSFFGTILKRGIAFFVFRDYKFEGAVLSGGSMTARLGDQTLGISEIRAQLNADHIIELLCGIEFKWPSKKMNLTVPLVQLRTDRAISLIDPRIGCSMSFKEAVFESPGANFRNAQAEAKLLYRAGLRNLTFKNMDITLQEADIKKGAQGDTIPLDLHLKADGAFSLKDRQLTADLLHLTVGNRLQLDGKLDAAVGTQKELKFKIRNCRVTPQDLLPFLPSGIRKRLGSLKLAGPIHLTGRIGGLEVQEKWEWNCDLQARLKQNQISYTTGNFSFSGALTGNVRAEGRVPDLKISATMQATHAMFSGNGIDLQPSRAAISFSGKHPFFELKEFSARIPHASGMFKKKEFLMDDVRLQVQTGRVNMADHAVSLPEIRFNSDLLRNLTASIDAAGGKISVGIQGEQTGLIALAIDLDLLPSGWKFAGSDSVQIQAEFEKEKGVSFTSELAFQNLGFQDRESTSVGEKVSLKTTANGKIDLSKHIIAADISIHADRGEVLYDRFYVDLTKNPFSFLCKGRYDMHGRHLQLSNLRHGLKDIMTCQMNGSIFEKDHDWRFDLSSDIPKTPLKPLFSHFIVEPFQAEKPVLSTIQMGGMVSADLTLAGTRSDWVVKGYFIWDEGKFSSEDNGMILKGIDLSLPLWYQNSEGRKSPEMLKGELSIRSALFSPLPEQSLAFPLDAGPNRLSINSPTVLKVPGGDVRVGPVVIRDLTGSSPSGRTSLSLNAIDMTPLLADVYARPIRGTISGKLNPIDLEGGNFKSIGKITAKVFDGEVILSDLCASGLLTGTPVFKLSVRWNDLNLSKLTAGTSFGKIEGVLKGHAKELEMANGQPQKFDLLLETVEKSGAPQRISVKAVDNIAQLGGGQSPFIGIAGIFASLFKEFPYEKIGVHATLENDVFRINGTIREGGKEYLVKRGLFSGVNVVNQNPDSRVSFKDMVKRIKRVTTSKSGPVIQ